MHLPVGSLLNSGKYKIVRFISSGGFGCTYEAQHIMLGERVAIKEFFVKDFCNRDEATAHVTIGTQSKRGLIDKLKSKFIDEAKMLYRMQHPGIVRVFDIFEENGTAYFVMDYVDGLSLNQIVAKEGALSEERAVRYISQVAEGLDYVHKNDCLHLDIKPGNIIINNADNAILIDFGTSKQYDEVDGENTSTLLGKTPGYAPLEQMGNDVVKFTPATDIYALGATLYKLLTGITPPSATLIASGEDLEPLPAVTSPSVCQAIMESMNINKKKRPQSIDEFLAILKVVNTDYKQQEAILQDQHSISKNTHSSQSTNEETLIIENCKCPPRDTNTIKTEPVNTPNNNAGSKIQSAPIKDKEYHPLLKFTMWSLMVVSSLGVVILPYFIVKGLYYDLKGYIGLFFQTYHFAQIFYMLPLCVLTIIGLRQIFKYQLKGFWFIAMTVPMVNMLQPITAFATRGAMLRGIYDYYLFIWLIAPAISILAFYGLLHLEHKDQNALSIMEHAPSWMKKISYIAWGIFTITMLCLLLPS